ncbi:hypothetical protein Clacol_007498 [Clathrus columnatus]|uniref:Phospho-2-dehydro-3-deoxyheptonate aldolase n=1 Tax=Clathrus columnatus TaxID=1419009 RepID=A0AAV5AF38_9AGAM|nr:hypothetical protein Clacol_007498 [Clathrus columnatus]
MSSSPWSISSWKQKSISQIEKLPPLVTPSEIERLRHQISLVQAKKAFILHAGDCAESFDACTQDNIRAKIGLILTFSLILIWGARLPVVRIGRIAGQYAKPRSSGYEIIGDKKILSFRLDPEDRIPNPDRLLNAYFYSTTTLNQIRGLLTSGFASLHFHHPRDWSLSHVRSPTLRQQFERIASSLADALDFTSTVGAGDGVPYEKGGLMLGYEGALTRELPIPRPSPLSSDPPKAFYNTSAHFLWIGDRTRQLDGAHVEYFRGIRNPIGIKVGPSMQRDELVRLLDIVNPDKELGRVTLITRYGATKIEKFLSDHITAVQKSGHPVAWDSKFIIKIGASTQVSSSGLKTRQFSDIVSELTASLRIHAATKSVLNGVSLEFTGEFNDEGFSVTECLGGSMELNEEELGLRYQSFCDPRLNFEQSLDLAFLISNHMKELRQELTIANPKYGDILLSELGATSTSAVSKS